MASSPRGRRSGWTSVEPSDPMRGGDPLAMPAPGLGLGGQGRPSCTERGDGRGCGPNGVPGSDVDPPDGGRGGQQARSVGCRARDGVGEAAGNVIDTAAALDGLCGIVEPGTCGEQVAHGARRLAAGDERPHVPTGGQPTRDHLRRRRQMEGAPAAIQAPSVARVDDRPATGRDHARRPRCWIGRPEPLDGHPLARPEAGFALGLEDANDARPGGLLDGLVEVDEGGPACPCHAPSDGALAAPRRADQHDVHGGLSRPRRNLTPPRSPARSRGRRSRRVCARDTVPGCHAPRGRSRRRTSRARSAPA